MPSIGHWKKYSDRKIRFSPQKTLNPICPVKTRIPAQACVMVESMLGRIYAHVIRQGDPPRGAGPRLLHLLHHVVPGLVPVGELLPAPAVDVSHELEPVSTKPASLLSSSFLAITSSSS